MAFSVFYLSPVDVIGAESRLVRYFPLSAVFIAPINNAGVWSHLVYPVLFRAFAFCLVHRCYFHYACFARAWFVLNLLPIRELPMFCPCLH
jgi:hypothetical protein